MENGQDALDFMAMQPADIVIIADNLADFTPSQIIAKAKEEGILNVAPVLLLYREPSTFDAVKSQINKSLVTLAKPFDRDALCKSLHQLTGANCFSEKQVITAAPKRVISDTGGSVLIVDDESSNIEVAAGILRSHYRIIAAKNGKQALQILAKQHQKIDLVLLDIMMPEMDGYQVCEAIKNSSDTQKIPVIFLTAKSQIEDITKGFETGAVDYITKPLQGEILLARVNTHISLKRNQEKLAQQVHQLQETAQLREDIEKITQHDLKAPLASILFQAGKIKDVPLASAIKTTVNNVIGMINLSLELYKIEQGLYEFTPAPTQLPPLVLDAITGCQLDAQSKKVSIKFKDNTKKLANVEPLLCLSIFNNLIKNAVEAAPPNSKISIVLEEAEQALSFTCKNAGVVPETLRHTLFDKYATGNIKQGSGLGAYSAKLLAEAQGGHIQYEIEQEQFTVFTVTLPAH